MKKSLGQHYLDSPSIARRIAGAAGVGPDETALEVGPGKGMLTRALLRCTDHVIAIEKDDELIAALEETFSAEVAGNQLHLVSGDASTVTPTSLGLTDHRYAVAANIPYNITGALIRHYLTAEAQPHTVVMLVQKEVADQIARSQQETKLSLSVKAYGTPQFLGVVRAGCFRPAPRVDSAILRITDINRDLFDTTLTEDWFFEVIRTAFAHKRKLAARNLEALASRSAVQAALEQAEVSETARPDTLSVTQWAAVSRRLAEEIC